ncbi:MAG: hypothetical protein AB7I18_12360 [Candidatus Berkiella sp.]
MRIYSGIKTGSLLLLLTMPLIAEAVSTGSSSSIGDAADSLMTPVAIMTKLSLLACYIIGIALILASIAQYKIHRQSPKLVPLTTPITLLLLGLTAVGIPYATNLFGESYSAEQQKPSETKSSGLPLPDLDANKGPRLPGSQQPKSDASPPPTVAPSPVEEPPSSGGRWTDDPQYNR